LQDAAAVPFCGRPIYSFGCKQFQSLSDVIKEKTPCVRIFISLE
jgi:hypothetical protein